MFSFYSFFIFDYPLEKYQNIEHIHYSQQIAGHSEKYICIFIKLIKPALMCSYLSPAVGAARATLMYSNLMSDSVSVIQCGSEKRRGGMYNNKIQQSKWSIKEVLQ